MNIPHRPTEQPVKFKIVLLFFILCSIILAIATGYYHQRWQNQVKRTARIQKQLDVLTATQTGTLKVDPTQTTK